MQLTDATAIPVILGLTQVVKELGLPDHFAPAVSLILGIVAGFFTQTSPANAIATGIMYGLSASGFYSGAKTVSNYVQNGPSGSHPVTPDAPVTDIDLTPNPVEQTEPSNEGDTNTL